MALFDSKTIFVGFITVFQLLSFLIVFCTIIGKMNSFNDVMALVLYVFCIPILFSILVYMYSGNLTNIKILVEDWKYRLLNATTVGSIIGFLGLIGNRNAIQNLKSEEKGTKILICIMTSLEIIVLYTAFYIACRDNIFKEIYKTYLFYSITSVPFVVSVLGDGFPFVNKKENMVLFKYDGKPIKVDYWFIVLYLLVLFMITLTNYSKKVFPYISSNMGGGYYKYNTIVLDDDSVINGKIIHSNSEYIYIIEEEDKLSQYSIDKIKSYEVTKSNDIVGVPVNENKMEVIEDEPISDVIEE